MNADIGSERDIQQASLFDSAEDSPGEQRRMSSTSAIIFDKDKNPLSSSGPSDRDTLLRELFAYMVNWAKRFYRGRPNRDRQKVVAFVSRALLPDACPPETSTLSLPDRSRIHGHPSSSGINAQGVIGILGLFRKILL